MRDYIKLCNSDQLFSGKVVLVREYSPGIYEWESQCADSVNALRTHIYLGGFLIIIIILKLVHAHLAISSWAPKKNMWCTACTE